jgi:hypothetical protein
MMEYDFCSLRSILFHAKTLRCAELFLLPLLDLQNEGGIKTKSFPINNKTG